MNACAAKVLLNANNYTRENFWDAVNDLDVVYDTLGGEALSKSFGIVKSGGKVISIAGTPEPQTARDEDLGLATQALFWFVSRKQRKLADRVGVGYRYIFMVPDGEQLQKIADLFESGKLKPPEIKVFSLENALSAIAEVEAGHTRGKVVLQISQ